MAWHQCVECIFASNSPRNATNHTEETGHEIVEEED